MPLYKACTGDQEEARHLSLALERNPNSLHLQIRNVELRKSLKNLLLREEIDLKQKSKVSWLKEGDKVLSLHTLVIKLPTSQVEGSKAQLSTVLVDCSIDTLSPAP